MSKLFRVKTHQLVVYRAGFPHIYSVYTYQNVESMIRNQQDLKERGFEALILHNGKIVRNPN
jgi:hypothetical protein